MFDSVKIQLYGREGEFADVHKRLSNCEGHVKEETGELQSYTGTIGGADGNNLFVRVTRACVTIGFSENRYNRKYTGNSLWKYAKGKNTVPFTRRDTADAIERISETLGVNIADANVSRLDAAVNVPLTHAPPEFFHLMGHSPRYKVRTIRHDGALAYAGAIEDGAQEDGAQIETLYYKTKRRELCLYDKGAKESLSEHVLRFELRYFEKISEQLHRKVNARNLWEADFRTLILQNLKNEYSKIKKANNMKHYNSIPFKTNGELKTVVSFRWLCEILGGAAGAEAWLLEKQKEYGISRAELKRMRDDVRELYEHENADGGDANALVQELDSAMAGAIAAVSEDNAAGN